MSVMRAGSSEQDTVKSISKTTKTGANLEIFLSIMLLLFGIIELKNGRFSGLNI